MERFVEFINRIFREEEGQDLVEYAMLLGFIALVAVAGVTLLGTNVSNLFDTLANQLPT
jgi:pilus assembly protein Flp/PilA